MTNVHVVQKGESLWTIVRNNYNCSNNQEISDTVNQIIQSNRDVITGDGNTIFTGQQIKLPENDFSIHEDMADEFVKWAASDSKDDFKIFDCEPGHCANEDYSKKADDFAKELIDKYDSDKSGELDIAEYAKFHSDINASKTTVTDGFNNLNKISGKADNDKTISIKNMANILKSADKEEKWVGFDSFRPEFDGKINKEVFVGANNGKTTVNVDYGEA